ncbi:unnamed protein product [Soboliphyme baturini]|uniref:Spermatogenesis associated 6 n=1 Tax=Soboliphyme baturini TaxID=241478 RepID=A0A183J3X9_9BILA|nr:unnamed protein product [Soboliphyme baturini]
MMKIEPLSPSPDFPEEHPPAVKATPVLRVDPLPEAVSKLSTAVHDSSHHSKSKAAASSDTSKRTPLPPKVSKVENIRSISSETSSKRSDHHEYHGKHRTKAEREPSFGERPRSSTKHSKMEQKYRIKNNSVERSPARRPPSSLHHTRRSGDRGLTKPTLKRTYEQFSQEYTRRADNAHRNHYGGRKPDNRSVERLGRDNRPSRSNAAFPLFEKKLPSLLDLHLPRPQMETRPEYDMPAFPPLATVPQTQVDIPLLFSASLCHLLPALIKQLPRWAVLVC